jgi:hypothetical protein
MTLTNDPDTHRRTAGPFVDEDPEHHRFRVHR